MIQLAFVLSHFMHRLAYRDAGLLFPIKRAVILHHFLL